MSTYKTEQEEFWSSQFGDEYIVRNKGDQLLASNLHFFSKVLENCGEVRSVIEFGANIGMNLIALQLLIPQLDASAVEINEQACQHLSDVISKANIYNESILEVNLTGRAFDMVLIKGVLIHINPDLLDIVYQKLYTASLKYILIAEYYNPTPVMIKYRGHENRLFKRDFAGEMLERYPDLSLTTYGFSYRRDPVFPQDDINWFLLTKK